MLTVIHAIRAALVRVFTVLVFQDPADRGPRC